MKKRMAALFFAGALVFQNTAYAFGSEELLLPEIGDISADALLEESYSAEDEVQENFSGELYLEDSGEYEMDILEEEPSYGEIGLITDLVSAGTPDDNINDNDEETDAEFEDMIVELEVEQDSETAAFAQYSDEEDADAFLSESDMIEEMSDDLLDTVSEKTMEAPYRLTTEEAVTVVTDEDTDYTAYLEFIPEQSGKYIFYSADEFGNPYASLQNSNGEMIKTDDDGGEGMNFHIEVELLKNTTYYLRVLNEEESEFPVYVELLAAGTFAERYQDCPALVLGVPQVIRYDGTVKSGSLLFTPDEAGEYAFYSEDYQEYDYVDTYAELYTSEAVFIDSNDQDGVNSHFCLEATLQAGTTYILQTREYNRESAEYVVFVEKPLKVINLAAELRGSGSFLAKEDEDIGYWDYYEDENGIETQYFYYDRNAIEALIRITITYEDGSLEILTGNALRDKAGLCLDYSCASWHAGGQDNIVTCSYKGFVTDINIPIMEKSNSEKVNRCGYSAYWDYDASTQKLTISGQGDTFDYSYFGSPKAPWNDLIVTSLEIQSGITGIGEWAFYGTDIQQIHFPETIDYIGENAFGYQLESITVDSANKTYSAVDGVLLDKAASKVLCFPHGKRDSFLIPSSVTAIGNSAFKFCALPALTIPGTVRTIEDEAFYGNYIQELTIENGVRSIGKRAFASWDGAAEIVLPPSVKTIGVGAFEDCSRLEEVVLPQDLERLEKNTFSDCYSLKRITLPESLTYIGSDSINCRKVANLTVFPNVKTIAEDAFSNCENTVFHGEEGSVIHEYALSHKLHFQVLGKNETVVVREGTCGDNLWWQVDNNATLTIGGTGDMQDYDYDHLERVPWNSVSDFIDRIAVKNGVEGIGNYAFYLCKEIEEVTLSDTITRIGNSEFSDAYKLKTINIPSSVIQIGENVFPCYGKMEEIEVNGENPAYCSIDGVLYDRMVTALLYYPCAKEDAAYHVPGTVQKIIGYAFYNCTNVEKVYVPASVQTVGTYQVYQYDGEDHSYTIPAMVWGVGVPSNIEIFLYGDAPEGTLLSPGDWGDVTVYYPEGNASYTEEVRQRLFNIGEWYRDYCRWLAWNPETEIIRPRHTLTRVPAKAAFCEEEGNIEHFICSDCGKLFKDAEGENEITLEQTVLAALGHTSDAGTVTKAASCTSEGLKTYSCTRCGKTIKTEPIAATGHTFSNWNTTSEATVFAEEVQSRTCNVCGLTEQRTVGSKLKPTIKVNAATVPLKVKQSTAKLVISGLATGDSVKSWKSSDTKIVKVDSKGKLTAQNKTGKATITVTLASGLTQKITVNVQKKAVSTTSIGGLSKKVSVKKGSKLTLAPVLNPISSVEKISYSTSNNKVATVSPKGVVKALKAGTAKITVKAGKKKFVVTVTVPKTSTTKITGIKSAITVNKGKSTTLKPKLAPSNSDEKVTFSSSNKKVASVDAKGKIIGKKKGTAVITVKSGKIKMKCKVTVK